MTTQREIMELERTFWQAMCDMDSDTAASMLDDQSAVVAARGIHHMDPTAYKQMAERGDVRMIDFTMSDEKVMFPTPDVAIATYKVDQSFSIGGKEMRMVAFDTTTWVRKNGRWVASAHTETPEQKAA